MPRRGRLPREFQLVGQGIETSTHAFNRGSREGRSVIKGYDQTLGRGYDRSGFNREIRDRLNENYKPLQETYGDVIPRQHFLRRRLQRERYKLVQEKIDAAKPASVFKYAIDTLPEPAQKQVERVAAKLELELVKASNPDKAIAETAVLIDLRNPDNFIVSTEGRAHYVDTGLMNQRDYSGEDYFHWKQRLAPLALLKLSSHRPVAEILDNPLFAPLIERLVSHHGFERSQAAEDKTYLYNIIKRFYEQRG